jgi:hypothetical protein
MEDPGARSRLAVAAALQHPHPVTHVAHGAARVDRVASNRRVARDAQGRVRAMRLSSCTDPELIALPEGTIDPELQTLAFYGEDGRKVVAAHYYATHPMSFYRDQLEDYLSGLHLKAESRSRHLRARTASVPHI